MKLRIVEMQEKGKGEFKHVEIPDGYWLATFKSLNTAVPLNEMQPVLPLPDELKQTHGVEGRRKLHDYIEGNWVATLSGEAINPQWYVLGYIPPCEDYDPEIDLTPEYQGRGHWHYALVADKPFVVICWDNRDYYHDHYDLYWEDVVPARQVQGKKASDLPKVPHPHFVRGANDWRWARLSELAQTLGEDPMTLWEFYFHICIGTSRIGLGQTDHSLFLCRGDAPTGQCEETKEEVGVVPPPIWWAETLAEEPYSSFRNEKFPERTPELVWVPAGWAMTACYLHHFGFKPAQVKQPV